MMNNLVWLVKGFGFYSVISNRDPLSSFKPLSNMISFAFLQYYSENEFAVIQT